MLLMHFIRKIHDTMSPCHLTMVIILVKAGLRLMAGEGVTLRYLHMFNEFQWDIVLCSKSSKEFPLGFIYFYS